MEFIEGQKILYVDLTSQYEELGALYDKKLWHELSLALESFLSNAQNQRQDNFLELYDSFLCSFETRLNLVKLAKLLFLIGSSLKDPSKSLEFYTKVLENRPKLGTEACLCLDMDSVSALLQLGRVDEAKALLEIAKESLTSISSTESVVFSKFYMATAEYKKLIGPPQDFYSAGLMFLAYTPVEDLNPEVQYKLATDMALASITGEDIFNFGEVIATPILRCLVGTPNEWLHDLVLSLNSGDIDQFNLIVDKYKEQYYSQPALASMHEKVKQKVVLLCLMNIAFERSSNDRQIRLCDIATATRIPLVDVEWVLMRAMSLGLIKGIIDEVDSVVNITWIQPRVLDTGRIGLLVEQLGGWTDRVKSALVTIEDQTHELFV